MMSLLFVQLNSTARPPGFSTDVSLCYLMAVVDIRKEKLSLLSKGSESALSHCVLREDPGYFVTGPTRHKRDPVPF